MNSKERVFATMNFQPVDRPAVFPLEGSAWICRKNNISYEDMYKLPDYGAQMLVDGFKEMKSDAIFVGGSMWMGWTNAFGAEIDASRIGMSVEVKPVFTDPETQIPEMTREEIRETLLGNYYIQAMLGQIKAAKAIVGDEYPIMSGHDGPFTGAGMLMGIPEFLIAMAKKKDYFGKLMDFVTDVIAVYADLMVEAGCDILNCCDPVASGDMISARHFNKFSAPALKDYMAKRELKDAPVLVHMCGKSDSRVEFMCEMGAEFFSVDSMVDMQTAIEVADKKMVMVGNINPAEIMKGGTPQMVFDETTKILEMAAANGGGIIPSTGCELPAESPLENILAMAEAAEAFANR